MSTHPVQLNIDQTWDGQPVAPEQAVRWTLHGDEATLVLHVAAPFYGDPPPPATPAGPTTALWEHEVVELFIAGPGEHYIEIELGPHGHHLVLELQGTRQVTRERIPIEFSARIEGTTWTGQAQIPRTLLPAAPHRVGAFAIHGSGPSRVYLSMVTLPGDAPDFHQLDRLQPARLP